MDDDIIQLVIDRKVRAIALDAAITYHKDCTTSTSADEVITDAQKFYNFIIGEKVDEEV